MKPNKGESSMDENEMGQLSKIKKEKLYENVYERYEYATIEDYCNDFNVEVESIYGDFIPRLVFFYDSKKSRFHERIALISTSITFINANDIIDVDIDTGLKTEVGYSILGGIAGGLASGSKVGQLYGGLALGTKEYANVRLIITTKYMPHYISIVSNKKTTDPFVQNLGSILRKIEFSFNQVVDVSKKYSTDRKNIDINELEQIFARMKQRDPNYELFLNEPQKNEIGMYDTNITDPVIREKHNILNILIQEFQNLGYKIINGYDVFYTDNIFIVQMETSDVAIKIIQPSIGKQRYEPLEEDPNYDMNENDNEDNSGNLKEENQIKLMNITKNILIKHKIEFKKGIQYGFTTKAIVVNGDNSDYQMKFIRPKEEERYVIINRSVYSQKEYQNSKNQASNKQIDESTATTNATKDNISINKIFMIIMLLGILLVAFAIYYSEMQ